MANKKRRPMPKGRKGKDDRDFDRRQRSRDEDYRKPDAYNDISWYSRYPNLLAAAGSFPFPYRPGMKMQLGQVSNPTIEGAKITTNFTIPGVLAIDWIPTIGKSNEATDPASIAGKELYARVRRAYSGSLDADAPDFVMYLMALDSIFAYIAWLKRVYRTLSAWTPENYVLPDGLMAAFGFATPDITGLRSNKTKLWQCINELVLQSRKFTCPAVMDIFNRHYWMSDNVYADDQTINSQLFVFNLVGVYQYADTPIPGDSKNTAAGLQLVKLPPFSRTGTAQTDTITVDMLYQFGLQLINALVAWDDAYTINGYLSRAFEGAPNFIVAELPQDELLSPVFVPEVLAQIENMRIVPVFDYTKQDFANFKVAQNPLTNAIVVNPRYTVTKSDAKYGEFLTETYDTNPVLSVRSDNPTVADSVIASRLQAAVEVSSQTDTTITFNVYCGTECPLSLRYYAGKEDYISSIQYPTFIPQYVALNPLAKAPLNWTMVLNLEQFDWHPFIFCFAFSTINNETLVPGAIRVCGDTHNITVIKKADLINLHTICIYSELNAFSI